MSIKNQMQLQLQYAEAQEEEFRQMIRLKRKRVAALKKQMPPGKTQADETVDKKREKSANEKDGAATGASSMNQKQSEEEVDFLMVLRQQMVHL